MADYEVKAVDSGFYDAIDEDRLYAAATMNLPYKGMISDGILGEQIGDDIPGFKIHAITGRKIRIDAGNALLGGRWVENKGVTLTIPTIPSGFERIDGVFLRVDTNEDVRGASIRVREGSVTPDTSEGVHEMKIAALRLYGSADVEIADHRKFARVLVAESQLQAILTEIMEEHPELIATIPDLSVTTAKLADEAVTTDKIAGNAVDAEKLTSGAVTTVRLAAGAVTTEKLADNAVETAKIKDANVTEAKLASGAVTTSKIDSEAVTAAKIGPQAVEKSKIKDGAVDTEKIKDAAVTTDKIADGNVITSKLDDSAVTTAKIADDAVTNDKIADSAVDTDQLADGSVTGNKILAGTIGSVRLANGAVTEDKIGSGAVTSGKLGSDVTATLNGKLDTSTFNALGLSVSDGKLCITYDEA